MMKLPVLVSSVFFSLVFLQVASLSLLCAADPSPQEKRNLVTDEPRKQKGKPSGAAEYVAKSRPTDGQHLTLSIQKLESGIRPERPFLIWALGSSYCNMLGNGDFWKAELPKRYPRAPPIEFRKMVGNSCPWQYLQGWARHLVVPDQPDLVIIYTIGKAADLEKVILELRTHTTADIIVPSIHWRIRDAAMWGKSENAADQDVAALRSLCRKHEVEFVESRRDWADYLKANELPIESLLKDAVHQSEYGALMINRNILAHFRQPQAFSYTADSRERRISWKTSDDGSLAAQFVGTRIDLHGKKSPGGGSFQVRIDGKPAEQTDAFLMSYVQPGKENSQLKFGRSPTVPRDTGPHGITLGKGVQPQTWTVVVTNDEGDFELTGSKAGPDGSGNAFKRFLSASGQIAIEPELWRRAERNRSGDRFTFDVTRSTLETVSFQGEDAEPFTARLAQMLPNESHLIELVPIGNGTAKIDSFEVFQPPFGQTVVEK
ncbi:MAG: SGNH/GDSL hydrolase family protein [Rubripirellula sp.]